MNCETCLLIEGDNIDNLIYFIFGHKPNCINFKINKDTFLFEFERQVLLKANEISNSNDKIDRKSTQIIKSLYLYLMDRYFPIVPNIYIYNWESDLLALNKDSKYITEYEIKISRSDFKADFKKQDKHTLISDGYNYKCNFSQIPNYFYYVTTPGLLNKNELPEYAGLIECGLGIKIIKKAPLLHKEKQELLEQLLRKIYFKYWQK